MDFNGFSILAGALGGVLTILFTGIGQLWKQRWDNRVAASTAKATETTAAAAARKDAFEEVWRLYEALLAQNAGQQKQIDELKAAWAKCEEQHRDTQEKVERLEGTVNKSLGH